MRFFNTKTWRVISMLLAVLAIVVMWDARQEDSILPFGNDHHTISALVAVTLLFLSIFPNLVKIIRGDNDRPSGQH